MYSSNPAACYKSCGYSLAYYAPGYNYIASRTYCGAHWAGLPRPNYVYKSVMDDTIPTTTPHAETEFFLDDYIIDDVNYTVTFSVSGFMRLTEEKNQFASLEFFIWDATKEDPDTEDWERDEEYQLWAYSIIITEEEMVKGEGLLQSYADFYDYYEFDGSVYLDIEGLEFSISYDPGIDPEALVVGSQTDVGELEEEGLLKTSTQNLAPPKKESILKVFPNPANDKITTTFLSSHDKDVIFTIVDVNGKTLDTKSSESNSGNFTNQFDISQYPSGIYFISVTGKNGKQIVKKVVKL
ncbi:hypothetical protein BH09BAC1_BH09BAC1_00040 [soil metagenome]